MSEFDFNHGHKKRQELASNIANSYQQQSSAATPELQKGEEQLSAEFDFNHAHNHRSLMKSQIRNSFIQEESTTGSISKSEEDELEKGGKRAVIGEKRTFGGREYIKTSSGWKFHGKGTGAKAQEHVKNSSTESSKKSSEEKVESASLSDEEFKKRKQHLLDRMDRMKTGGPGFKKLQTQLAQLIADNKSSKREATPKAKTFEEVLADPEGRKHIEAIEHGSSDSEVIAYHKKELKEKHGFTYDEVGDEKTKTTRYSPDGEGGFKGADGSTIKTVAIDPKDLRSSREEKKSNKREAAPEGTIRESGGRQYIKKDGKWKYHPKGASKSTDSGSKKNLSDLSLEEYSRAVEETANKFIANTGKTSRRYIGEYEHDSFASPFGKESGHPSAVGRDKFIADVDKKVAQIKRSKKKEESKSVSEKHIGDMSATEKKALATKLGISTEGKTTKQVDKAITDAIVDKQLADWKASKEEKSKDEQSKSLSTSLSKKKERTSKEPYDEDSELYDSVDRGGVKRIDQRFFKGTQAQFEKYFQKYQNKNIPINGDSDTFKVLGISVRDDGYTQFVGAIGSYSELVHVDPQQVENNKIIDWMGGGDSLKTGVHINLDRF